MKCLRVLSFFLIFTLGMSQQSLATVCNPKAYGPVCQRIHQIAVAFLGQMLQVEENPWSPSIHGPRLHRFQIERVYKGLDPALDEVLVSSGNFGETIRYRKGERYLILGGSDAEGLVISGICNTSKLAEHATEDLSFLEEYAKGLTETTVFGRVVQSVSSYGRTDPATSAPLANAVVILESPFQTQFEVADDEGNFQFDTVEPGSYRISAQLEPFTSDPAGSRIEVAAGGCVEAFLKLEAGCAVSGNLFLPDHTPFASGRVELLRRNRAGEWYSTSSFWTQADADGRFNFENIPSGEYLLGYEIWGDSPSPSSSYPSRYYPGVSDRDQATVIQLEPHERLEEISLFMAEQDTERTIQIRVVWTDGSPPGQNLLQLIDGRTLLRNFRGDESSLGRVPIRVLDEGLYEFIGHEERSYRFSVRYWIDDPQGPEHLHGRRSAESDIVVLEPGPGPASVTLVLGQQVDGAQH